jgi:hypothetical protein
VIVSNTGDFGGCAFQGTISASLFTANYPAAVDSAVLNNCTIVSNSYYGVANPMAMTNCIIYFNGFSSANNYSVSGSAFSHCCTTPALAGTGNFTNAPQLLVDNAHLAANSPCIGAGIGTLGGTDLFGNVWSSPPSVGCSEWSPAPVVAAMPAAHFPLTGGVAIGAVVAGQPPFTCWWTRDGVPLQADGNHNAVNTTTLLINNFALSDAGAYQVVVSNSFGMATSSVDQVSVHCVAATGAALPPYSSWGSAATNIEQAIAIAQAGDIVLVTNGLYTYGSRIMDGTQSNRVALPLPIMVQSVNGPWVTTIQGGNRTNGAPVTRCAWLTNGAALAGFTLEGGATLNDNECGGGVWCASSNAAVANCLICSNLAIGPGGGVYSGTIRNCAIIGNNSNQNGGGTSGSCLDNCTVISNYAGGLGGGTYLSLALTNCIVYYNSNAGAANLYGPGPASYCCTEPLPSEGTGNITNPPQLFVDEVHLLPNSPCIGAGTDLGASSDIDGQPWNNPPSIGCSEISLTPVVASPIIETTNNPAGISITAAITGVEPLSCWWLENGIPLQDNAQFSSTHTAGLTASALLYADAGAYQLVVSNSFGVVTSAVVQVVVHCVDAGGTNPVSPYLTWDTAATNIQDAIAASSAGDIVLVTNGIYAYGGISMTAPFNFVLTNRVSINKAILVQSVNGPAATVIQGGWDSTNTNGPGAVRCVWMTNNAILDGFTIRGGATQDGSATPGPAVGGGGIFGTTNSAIVNNCVIVNNFAFYVGGGAYGVTLSGCTLKANHASTTGGGGGAERCNLKNCFVISNIADEGRGGGVENCNLQNCALVDNFGYEQGGAANYGTLVNCTITGNISPGSAVYGAALTNCIVMGNVSQSTYPNNYFDCSLVYCCADPLPAGNGNIDVNPQVLADNVHLAATSPCIGAGSEYAVSGTDIDGQSWNNPPSMGCDEWQPAPVFALQPAFQIGAPPRLTLAVQIAGESPFAYFWTENGVSLQDSGHYTNSKTAGLTINNFGPDDAGAYQIIVTNAYGSITSVVDQVVIHVVKVAGSAPQPPFFSWTTAATNIQDAIDVSAAGDIVLVTNGLYASGGKVIDGTLTNRIALTNPVTVMSVNGFGATVIQGAWDPISTNGPAAVRCAYVADGAVLNGFTLQNGATLAYSAASGQPPGGPLGGGGGIYCSSANAQAANCILSNNSAIYGGGVANGSIANSLIVGNRANYGGGAFEANLNNCTVVNNASTVQGEGAGINFGLPTRPPNGVVRNSIVVGNYDNILSSTNLSDNYYLLGSYPSAFAYSCTSPLPVGDGNIDADPEFLDWYHVPVNSPLVGVGSTAYASGYDLDGEPWNNPPSMGCSEVVPADLNGPLSVHILSAWTNLLVNRAGDYSGLITGRPSWVQWSFNDGLTVSNTGSSAVHQWTNAGNYVVTFTAYNNDTPQGVSTTLPVIVQALDVPLLETPDLTTNGIQLRFNGQTNANYTIQYATNLVPPVAWQTLETINFNNHSTLKISDTSTTNATRYYRVLAQ